MTEQQQPQQPTQPPMRLRVAEKDAGTSYTNAFRTNLTAEELILEVGLNRVVAPPGEGGEAAEMLFEVAHRTVMNYHTAKRLAIALGQVVRQHEAQFGEVKLR